MEQHQQSSSATGSVYDTVLILTTLMKLTGSFLISDSSSLNSIIDEGVCSDSDLSNVCELVMPAIRATLALWRRAAGSTGGAGSSVSLGYTTARHAAGMISSWLFTAGGAAEIIHRNLGHAAAAAAGGHAGGISSAGNMLAKWSTLEGVLQQPGAAALLAIELARSACALHQWQQRQAYSVGNPNRNSLLSSSSSSSSSSRHKAPAQMAQEQQQQQQQQQQMPHDTPEDTSSMAPEQLYQLLLDAAGVPGLGRCNHSDEDDPDAAPAGGGSSSSVTGLLMNLAMPLHALEPALTQQDFAFDAAQMRGHSSSSSSSNADSKGMFNVMEQPLPLLQTLAASVVLLQRTAESDAVPIATECLQLMRHVLDIHHERLIVAARHASCSQSHGNASGGDVYSSSSSSTAGAMPCGTAQLGSVQFPPADGPSHVPGTSVVLHDTRSEAGPVGAAEAAAASAVAEPLLPLLLHSVSPAVLGMMKQQRQGQAVPVGQQQQQRERHQQLLLEMQCDLARLVIQVTLAGETSRGQLQD
jgi:hypothetical protein